MVFLGFTNWATQDQSTSQNPKALPLTPLWNRFPARQNVVIICYHHYLEANRSHYHIAVIILPPGTDLAANAAVAGADPLTGLGPPKLLAALAWAPAMGSHG